MSSQLTHWTVAKLVAKRFLEKSSDGLGFIRGDLIEPIEKWEGISKYFILGSSSPDLPYYYHADAIDQIFGWKGDPGGDFHHYNRQGEFLLNLVGVARELPDADRALRSRTMAFALGHTTHLVTDSILHPYISMFSGILRGQTCGDPGGYEMHMIAEVHQDSWLVPRYWPPKKNITQGYSWSYVVQLALTQTYIPGTPAGSTYVWEVCKQVFSKVAEAFARTHGEATYPDFEEHLRDGYENFFDNGLDIAFDGAYGPIPVKPSLPLVEHEKLGSPGQAAFFLDMVTNRVATAAARACDDVVALYYGGFSEAEQDDFRSKVRNWNMDTGWWIDVDIEGGELRIIWRHAWLDALGG